MTPVPPRGYVVRRAARERYLKVTATSCKIGNSGASVAATEPTEAASGARGRDHESFGDNPDASEHPSRRGSPRRRAPGTPGCTCRVTGRRSASGGWPDPLPRSSLRQVVLGAPGRPAHRATWRLEGDLAGGSGPRRSTDPGGG